MSSTSEVCYLISMLITVGQALTFVFLVCAELNLTANLSSGIEGSHCIRVVSTGFSSSLSLQVEEPD
jgi:hypothetical protein